MPAIIARAKWGFSGWRDGIAPEVVPLSDRTEFFVHYEGAPTDGAGGVAVPRAIHQYHRDVQRWRGIGYSWVVTQDGKIYEGRGWDYSGSHCPDHNRSGWAVQVHMGGTETPTPAALHSARWLYDQAVGRVGRPLAMRGHRDGYATECPGDRLYAWVRAGMPDPIPVVPKEDDDMTPEDFRDLLRNTMLPLAPSVASRLGRKEMSVSGLLQYAASNRGGVTPDDLADIVRDLAAQEAGQ